MPVNGLTELVLAGLAALAPLTAGPGKTGEVPLLPGHRAVAVAGPVSMSADGTHAAFLSAASNLVAGDGNGRPDVFVADLRSGAIQRIDAGAAGAVNDARPQPFTSRALERSPGLAISADGSKVAYVARPDGRAGVFVHDFAAATTERVSVATGGTPADGDSDRPLMTADGNLVFFSSRATNLLAAPTADGALLVRDRAAGTTAPAALDTAGEPLNPGGTEQSTPLAISPDGRFLAFVTNVARISTTRTSAHELVLADRTAGTLEMLSVDSAGRPGNNVVEAAAISDDGRTAIFETGATNLIAKGGGRNTHGFRHTLYVRTRG